MSLPRRPRPITIIAGDVWAHRVVFQNAPDLTGKTFSAILRPIRGGGDALVDPTVDITLLNIGEIRLSYTALQTNALSAVANVATLVVQNVTDALTVMVAEVRIELDPTP